MAKYFDVVDNRTGNIVSTCGYERAREIANRYNSASPYADFKVETSSEGWDRAWMDTYLG